MGSNRITRIVTALSNLRARLTENRQAVTERESLREQLAAVTSKWQALKAATYWAELDSGASVAVGDTVRYFGRTYSCKKAHTKALLRSPINSEYWEAVQDDD